MILVLFFFFKVEISCSSDLNGLDPKIILKLMSSYRL